MEWDRQQARKMGLHSRYRKTMEAWEKESSVYRDWQELESAQLRDRAGVSDDDDTMSSGVESMLSQDDDEEQEQEQEGAQALEVLVFPLCFFATSSLSPSILPLKTLLLGA